MQSTRLFHEDILPKLKTFKDLYKIRQQYNTKQNGDIFEIITKYIFYDKIIAITINYSSLDQP